MDTITHGIAGALLSKALFRGDDLISGAPVTAKRILTGAFVLGAIFPDFDMLRDFLSQNSMLVLTWHRSITHSLLCLPAFAVVLAALTRRFCRWRKWESPSFATLTAVYAAAILSHILLDLATSFGTMIWSPLEWARPAWDLLFIVDFTFSALLLAPQLLAWVYAKPENLRRRAVGVWALFTPAPLLIAALGQTVGAPISNRAVIVAMIIVAAVFLLPALGGWGLRVSHTGWNRAGLAAALVYLVCAGAAHHAALNRVRELVRLQNLPVESLAALPMPPSIWRWNGLVNTPRGVYEYRIDLSGPDPTKSVPGETAATAPTLEYRYYPDAASNSFIEAAKRLPAVRKVLWFSRFPVIRYHKEGTNYVVEILDIRFVPIRPDRPASFAYQVTFDQEGKVLNQGWLRRGKKG